MEDGLPAAYVAVNKVVKPVRIPNPDQLHSYSPYGNCFEKDSTDRWYARFDQEETG
ncbi:type VI immunity family protein [Pseudomonas syringae]|nr:type VI immunity family protein [Pseudomonas syringae]